MLVVDNSAEPERIVDLYFACSTERGLTQNMPPPPADLCVCVYIYTYKSEWKRNKKNLASSLSLVTTQERMWLHLENVWHHEACFQQRGERKAMFNTFKNAADFHEISVWLYAYTSLEEKTTHATYLLS